jgi:hypothetical protein
VSYLQLFRWRPKPQHFQAFDGVEVREFNLAYDLSYNPVQQGWAGRVAQGSVPVNALHAMLSRERLRQSYGR